jgi:hypothetical protein
MARSFNGSTQYMEHAAAVVGSHPLSMCCWFFANNVTSNGDLIAITNSASNAGRNCFRLAIRGNEAGDPLQSLQNDDTLGGGSIAASTIGYSASTWHHAASVFASSTSNTVYLDGGNNTTDATDKTPPSVNRTTIGALRQATNVNFFAGRLAFPCVWNAALTAAEIASLARGAHPSTVRPESIVALWELTGGSSPEPDRFGGFGLTLTASPTVADNPRILLPGRNRSFVSFSTGPTFPDQGDVRDGVVYGPTNNLTGTLAVGGGGGLNMGGLGQTGIGAF